MRKFLLFEYDKGKNTFELFSVFNGKSIESLHEEIVSEIKQDILLRSKYKSSNISILLGIPEIHKTFIEYKVNGFIYPPYYKTIVKNYMVREIIDERYYKRQI